LDIISQTHEQWQRLVKKQTDAGSLKWYANELLTAVWNYHRKMPFNNM